MLHSCRFGVGAVLSIATRCVALDRAFLVSEKGTRGHGPRLQRGQFLTCVPQPGLQQHRHRLQFPAERIQNISETFKRCCADQRGIPLLSKHDKGIASLTAIFE
jgi:hypothetical protein